jgi:hypothetical protein
MVFNLGEATPAKMRSNTKIWRKAYKAGVSAASFESVFADETPQPKGFIISASLAF